MRKAASESAAWLQQYYLNKKFIILCGPGNNGGDGLYIGIELSKLNSFVIIIDVLADKKKSALNQQAYFAASNLEFIGLDKLADVEKDFVVIDAIFGIGGRSELDSDLEKAIEITERFQHRVAIDMPTGLNPNTGNIISKCFSADQTITFLGIKLGQLINQGKIYTGNLILKDLSLNMNKNKKPIAHEFLFKDIKSLLPAREKDAHKGNHGKLLIVAGDKGYGGAGLLASEAALKTGAGLIKLLTRKSYVASTLSRNPEIMVIGSKNAQDLKDHFSWSEVLVCGPGMFENYWSEQLFFETMCHAEKNKIPTLLDAGALRLLSIEPFSKLSLPQNLILTPHPGEASCLLGISTEEVQKDRIKAAQDLHLKFGGTIVLKGRGTIVCDGQTNYLCGAGGPELAVAGSGDILSGVIGSLLAQGLSPKDASLAGVALHSKAGNEFSEKIGSIGLAASELVPLIRNILNS